MTLRHLKILISVCDHMSMSNAAKELFVSQPTVSQAISELEKCYGIQIFERLSKRLYLTDTGHEMLNYARHIVNLFAEMEERITDKKLQKLRIGATITVATYMLNTLLEGFSTRYPDSDYYVYIDNTNVIERMILGNELDIGIVEGKTQSANIKSIPVFEDDMVLVCGKKHPFFNKELIHINDLYDQDFILGMKGSGNRQLFDEMLSSTDIHINEKWTCNSSEVIKNAVMESKSLTVISRMLIEAEVGDCKLKIVRIGGVHLTRTIYLAYHQNKYFSGYMKQFISIAQSLSDSME